MSNTGGNSGSRASHEASKLSSPSGFDPGRLASALRHYADKEFTQGGCQWCALTEAADYIDTTAGITTPLEEARRRVALANRSKYTADILDGGWDTMPAIRKTLSEVLHERLVQEQSA